MYFCIYVSDCRLIVVESRLHAHMSLVFGLKSFFHVILGQLSYFHCINDKFHFSELQWMAFSLSCGRMHKLCQILGGDLVTIKIKCWLELVSPCSILGGGACAPATPPQSLRL